MKTRPTLAWLELVVWNLASLAAVYFLVAAIVFHTPWARLWWAIGIAVVAKWLASGLADNQARVAFEAALIAKGYSPEAAGKEWMSRYRAKGQEMRP